MGRVYISRKAKFCASHRYHNPAWSGAQNRNVFGPCNNPHGHGHNYELEVTVCGEVDPETGMVLNLREIDDIVKAEVIARVDHRHLNEDLPEWRDQIPTTENLVVDFWERLEPRFERAHARLYRLRLYESPDLHSEYYGESKEPLSAPTAGDTQ
jgi:6-pyruvoyltetrahydropterin/6-carboxytetrahydropterin synthase